MSLSVEMEPKDSFTEEDRDFMMLAFEEVSSKLMLSSAKDGQMHWLTSC